MMRQSRLAAKRQGVRPSEPVGALRKAGVYWRCVLVPRPGGRTVKQRNKTLFTTVLLATGLFGVAMAGPLEDGRAAYESGDYAAAMSYWRPLADQGNAAAQTGLGVMYNKGEGVPQDYAQALIWTRKAAEQGDAVAQNNLGVMYRDGQGVSQDYAQAVIWYRKAADQGDAAGQNNLGGMYYEGLSVPQDYVSAHIWFDLAASRASDADTRDLAIENRDAVAAKMTPAQIAEAQRMAREWKSK
jgi:TPR repeat protein